jgi:hypothetical protein
LDEFTIRGCTCGLNLLSVLLTFIQWYSAIKSLQLWDNYNNNVQNYIILYTVLASEVVPTDSSHRRSCKNFVYPRFGVLQLTNSYTDRHKKRLTLNFINIIK